MEIYSQYAGDSLSFRILRLHKICHMSQQTSRIFDGFISEYNAQLTLAAITVVEMVYVTAFCHIRFVVSPDFTPARATVIDRATIGRLMHLNIRIKISDIIVATECMEGLP